MNKRHYEHTLPNIRGSLSNTYEYILPILFGICLNVFIMLFFTGRLEDILIKCLEYLEALKWKIKRKMKRH